MVSYLHWWHKGAVQSWCLNPYCNGQWSHTHIISTLVILIAGLNPYCNGQWSHTRPYKTILIISKLKNFTKQILTFLNRKLTIPQRVQSYDFFLRYASQLFLNIQPFSAQKLSSINHCTFFAIDYKFNHQQKETPNNKQVAKKSMRNLLKNSLCRNFFHVPSPPICQTTNSIKIQ